MPVLPKSFLTIGAGLQTARMKRRLQETKTAEPAQWRTFQELMRMFAATSHGRLNGVKAAMSYANFQARVPLQTYELLAPSISRMQRGERDVLWPGECTFYAVTAGTAGAPKTLPVTNALLEHFNRAGRASLLHYTARSKNARVFRGRHLFLGGSTTLAAIRDAEPFVAYAGDISALAALNMPLAIERHLYEPGTAIAQITDWTEKIAAVVQRTLAADISLVAGVTPWLLELAEALLRGATGGNARPINLQMMWPNLECVVHSGVLLTPFYDDLRRAYGPTVNFHEVYAASEGVIAAQDATPGEGLRLIADAGLFFEFIPARKYDPARLPSLSADAMPLASVQAGVDYVLVLTTPGGLCRYVLGDVVRFISTEPPRLILVGRTELQLDAFGENVSEKDLTDTLLAVCRSHGWNIVNFHVAPLVNPSLTGQVRGRHEWWIELRAGTVQTPIGVTLASELDHDLAARNPSYAARRKADGFETPVVRLVMPGVFEHWMRHQHRWGGQSKMPRCRRDRLIADGLGAIARFNND
ncbi:MAG: hypothetical protein JWM88_1576 [Verrucomicrobia bacterium]|nr:hypothetical protein [Verrucomicrobiota bacterium]